MAKKLRLERIADDRLLLRSPGVGLWRGAPPPGQIIQPGEALGALEVLGVLHPLVAPEGASGVVVGARVGSDTLARRPVTYAEVLLELDPSAAFGAAVAGSNASAGDGEAALVFRAPSSGRYYGRPAPDKAPFVSVGDEVGPGQAIGLLEVMKTFTRIQYGGDGLPSKARIARIVPADGDDLDQDQVIFELEAL